MDISTSYCFTLIYDSLGRWIYASTCKCKLFQPLVQNRASLLETSQCWILKSLIHYTFQQLITHSDF